MFDTIVVGSGVIGMMTAQLLSQQGQKICLLEKGKCGSESSWAGGGILSPLYPWRYSTAVNTLATWSQQHYPEYLEKLKFDTGIDSECLQSGLLIQNINDQKPEIKNWINNHKIQAEFVSAAESQNIEPLISQDTGDSLWLPAIRQVRNPRLVKALQQEIMNNKIKLHENCEVLGIVTKRNQFTAVKTSKGTIPAKNIVIASGAWSGGLFNKIDNSNVSVRVEPVRGQMMIIKTPINTLRRIILKNGHYLIPRNDGRILVGSTIEHVGFDKRTTEQARQDLITAAIAIVPVLSDFFVEYHWAGLRPGTSQGIPYICKHPSISGIYLNSGHYRNGIVLALASAQLMTDMVLNRQQIVESTAYSCKINV